MTNRIDLYTRVTNALLADLEKGVRPWLQPWNGGRITRPVRANGQPYRGINVLMLWASARKQHFTAPIWMTFNQAKELKANVRKGAKGSLVVYANRITRTETDEDGEEHERDIPFLKGYTVFNVEQIDGLPPNFYTHAAPQLDPAQRIAAADTFFARTGADIRHGGDRAYYAPAPDYVQMPHFAAFTEPESYYGTLAHELTHWTKYPSRLDRNLGRSRFGDANYAREELVAEIGAAFLCCDLGITPEPRDDHAAYLGHWLAVLKQDTRAIFQAAAHAQRAVDYLHGLQPSGAGARPCEPETPALTRAPRFPLGQVVATGNASLRLSTEEVRTALQRHAAGDWGDLCPEDTMANDEALEHGGRLFSAYGQGAARFWIITEADRSVTTILLPTDC